MTEILGLLKISHEQAIGALTLEVDPDHSVEDLGVGVAEAAAVDLKVSQKVAPDLGRSRSCSKGRKSRLKSKSKPKFDGRSHSHSRSRSKDNYGKSRSTSRSRSPKENGKRDIKSKSGSQSRSHSPLPAQTSKAHSMFLGQKVLQGPDQVPVISPELYTLCTL